MGGVSEMTTYPLKFRSSFLYLWSRLTIFGIVLITFSTTTASFAATGQAFDRDHLTWLVLLSLFNAVIIGISVLMHVYAFPVIVTAEGISGFRYSLFNKKQQIAWSALAAVEPTRFFGMPCYRLTAHDSPAMIIVPRFLQNFARFEQELRQHPPINRPLAAVATANKSATAARRRTLPPEYQPVREGGYIVISTKQYRRDER
jgi:hypothetical protein